PTFAADSSWHSNSYQPAAQGCDWKCTQGDGSTITNVQVNLGTLWSKTNTATSNVYGDVNVSATAVGNQVEGVTMQDTEVDSSQDNQGQIGSEVNAEVDSVDGNVNLTATSVCNSTDVSTDPNATVVNNAQHCGAADPEATVNGNVTNVTGGVGMSA